MKIDIHNHAIPRVAIDLLRSNPAYRVVIADDAMMDAGGRYALPRFVDPRMKLHDLESAGLDAAVLSAATQLFFYHLAPALTDRFCRTLNEGFVEYCATYPERLRWNAMVPLNAPSLAVRTLESAAALGCSGVMIATNVCGRRLDDPELDVFWDAVEAVAKPVFLHPNYNEPHSGLDRFFLQVVIGNLLETTIAIERLICRGVFDRHPQLRIVLAHGGGYFPYQGGRLRHAASVREELQDAPKDPWAYVKCLRFDSLTHDAAALSYLASRVGVERVMIGTDMPYDMADASPLKSLRMLDDPGRAAVAGDNASVLYGFADTCSATDYVLGGLSPDVNQSLNMDERVGT